MAFSADARRDLQAALNGQQGPGTLRTTGAIAFTLAAVAGLLFFLPQIRQVFRTR